MRDRKFALLIVALLVIAGVSACQQDSASGPQSVQSDDSGMPSAAGEMSPGKPTAPIDIDYEVIGNAIVGMPVSINIVVTSPRGPVKVQYGLVDNSALQFQAGQVERLEIVDPSSGSVQQVTVIPQREGRVYVNVSAQIEAPDGLTIRSMAIPVKVGSAPEEATVNGELVEGPGGEKVISMPAQESN